MTRLVGDNLDFGGVSRLFNLLDAASPQEPATLAQLQSAVEGLAWKDDVRVSTQGNISIASPGATIDGVSMVAGDRVLVQAQTTQAENGIYIWNGAATPLTRSLDANTFAELHEAVTTVREGTSAGASYRQTQINGTLGSSAVIWASFGTGAPAASTTTPGVAALATQSEVDAGAVTNKIVTPATLAAYANRKLKFSQTFGDGSATNFVITHNLNTQDVLVAVYRTSGAFDEVLVGADRTTGNSVTLRFSSPPAANAFRCVVLG